MKKNVNKELTSVKIPTIIYRQIKERIRNTDFTSVSSYVTYVLKELLAQEEEKQKSFTEEDEKKIKARLRALGYIE